MNAHSTLVADHETPAITVRDLRFHRQAKPSRWWLNGDPVATAWHNALSATFPRGEAFFIESVKAFRDGAPPELEAEIRAFVRQEVNHSREHLAFNRSVTDAGYDVSRIDAHVSDMLDMTKGRPAAVNLAATMALEHFTAIIAHEFLSQPRHFKGAEPQAEAMWRWHAIEEIEHKAVAYDTYLHATRGWKRRKRWMLKAVMMVIITKNFVPHRIRDTLDLLEQDGLKGWKVKARVLWYLFGTPGVDRLFPARLPPVEPGRPPPDREG